jgi:putative phage-type endonuclease
VTSVRVLPASAPEAEWLEARRNGIGASEIAAVMGISPYDSPFSLWWRKFMGWETPENEEMSAGKRLEAVIADWFAEHHQEYRVRRTGLWANVDRAWQLATPDRLLMRPVLPEVPHGVWGIGGLLECKSAYNWDGWGAQDTAEIPVHYKAQCLWQLDTMGVGYVWVAAFSGLGFRQYLVNRDEKDLVMMREAGRRFMDSLAQGEPPNVDDHSATLPIIRRLNTEIEDRDVEIPASVASGWLRSKRFKDLATRAERRYAATLRAHLGTAKTATCSGRKIAARSSDDKLMRKS